VVGLFVGLLVGLPAATSLNLGGLAARGLVVLGVVVLGDDEPIFLFDVARLLLVIGVIAEGRFGLFHKVFWAKSEGQGVTFGGFPSILIWGRMVDTSSPLPLPETMSISSSR
jgi:hypothetical protein